MLKVCLAPVSGSTMTSQKSRISSQKSMISRRVGRSSTERGALLALNTTVCQPRSQGTLSTSRKYPGYGWSRVC